MSSEQIAVISIITTAVINLFGVAFWAGRYSALARALESRIDSMGSSLASLEDDVQSQGRSLAGIEAQMRQQDDWRRNPYRPTR